MTCTAGPSPLPHPYSPNNGNRVINEIRHSRRGTPICQSRAWLQRELDDTISCYLLIITITLEFRLTVISLYIFCSQRIAHTFSHKKTPLIRPHRSYGQRPHSGIVLSFTAQSLEGQEVDVVIDIRVQICSSSGLQNIRKWMNGKE